VSEETEGIEGIHSSHSGHEGLEKDGSLEQGFLKRRHVLRRFEPSKPSKFVRRKMPTLSVR
jgi:hypothetical protein